MFCLGKRKLACRSLGHEKHISVVVAGQTTYEVRNGSSRYSKASVKDNFRDVFGRHWPLLFFLPLPLPQAGNGCYSSPRRRVDRSTCAGRTKDELSHPGGDLMEKEKSKKGQEAARKILPSSEQKERLFKRVSNNIKRRKR